MNEPVLIVDDDIRLAEMVSQYLRSNGFDVHSRADATSGMTAARSRAWGAILLDVMLPDGDGFELCRQIRADSGPSRHAPILMLTARGDETDRIVGLELGADDYLPKPFNPRELLARVRALVRRAAWHIASEGQDVWRFGRLEIDRGARIVRKNGEERRLTSYQFDLLVALAERAGRVLSRDQLMEIVRGEELEAFDRSIDVHVSRIRAAIEDDPRTPTAVQTIRGVGYVFTPKGLE